MALSCPLGTTRHPRKKHFPRKPYNKSSIDQACSVKMAGFFFFFACLWNATTSWSITRIKRTWLISAILTSRLVNNSYSCIACSMLSVSGDDRKSGRAMSGVWERKGEVARFCVPPTFSIVPIDREPGTGYNLPVHSYTSGWIGLCKG